MKSSTRPQYQRRQRILELIREGRHAGSLPNCGHFMRELAVSRRTVMRDLDYLRDDHHAPICSLRANSGTGCGNGCVRDWLVADDPYWPAPAQHSTGATFDPPPWAKTSRKAGV